MSRYAIIPSIKQGATHTDASGAFFRVIDTQGKTVQGSPTLHDSIAHLTAIPAKPLPVPQSVPLWAFRATLAEDGLLSAVKAAATGAAAEFLEYGNFVDRNSPALAQIAAGLGKTPAQIDDVFRRAAAKRL